MIFWLFGQPGAGKTTIAEAFLKEHPDWLHVDGDAIRNIYGNNSHDYEGRVSNHIKAIHLCQFLQYSGKNVIVSMVTPYVLLRKMIVEKLKDVTFAWLTYSQEDMRGKEKFHVKDFENPRPEFLDMDFIYINTTLCKLDECVRLLSDRVK